MPRMCAREIDEAFDNDLTEQQLQMEADMQADDEAENYADYLLGPDQDPDRDAWLFDDPMDHGWGDPYYGD